MYSSHQRESKAIHWPTLAKQCVPGLNPLHCIWCAWRSVHSSFIRGLLRSPVQAFGETMVQVISLHFSVALKDEPPNGPWHSPFNRCPSPASVWSAHDHVQIHSKKKSTSEQLFWCFRLSQIEDCIQYLEGPNSTWKDHDRNLGVHLESVLV